MELVRVLVCSTHQDLIHYRAAASEVIQEMEWACDMMEHFAASPDTTVEFCRSKVNSCDVVLMLIGWRRGWVPSVEEGGNGTDSITALELMQAKQTGKPVLILRAAPDWPGNRFEDQDEDRAWVKRFHASVNQNAPTFEYEPESSGLHGFRNLVRRTLLEHQQFRLRKYGRSYPETDSAENLSLARSVLLKGTGIPVLGCGIHRTPCLTSDSLSRSMLNHEDMPPELREAGVPLATVAEYRERLEGSRPAFLACFREILEKQEAQSGMSPLLRIIANCDRLSFIVSTTSDMQLENALVAAGRKIVVISHVLRSEKKLQQTLLAARMNGPARFTTPGELQVGPDECVVYKVQGSPFLHDHTQPADAVDTVVVTESDHALFLRGLAEESVPFAWRMRRDTLLFAGYTMDSWQYRLMTQIFECVGRDGAKSATISVRRPVDAVEQAAWKMLNARLIPQTLDEFIAHLSPQPASAGKGA